MLHKGIIKNHVCDGLNQIHLCSYAIVYAQRIRIKGK